MITKLVKPIVEEDKLGVNPFLSTLRIPVNKITIPGQWERDKDGVMLPVEVELDRDTCCKVYIDAPRRKDMVSLSPRAKDLLLWLVYESETGKDWVWINYVRYLKECDVKSYNTYKTAIRELVIKNFIGLTLVQHVYYINPHYFFNGSRIARFPNNIIRK